MNGDQSALHKPLLIRPDLCAQKHMLDAPAGTLACCYDIPSQDWTPNTNTSPLRIADQRALSPGGKTVADFGLSLGPRGDSL